MSSGTFLAHLRDRAWRSEILARERCLAAAPDARARLVLERLNDAWTHALGSPYWSAIRGVRGLPRRFDSLEAFRDAVPTTSRAELRENLATMARPAPGAEFARITGGSTAEPVQIPSWNAEIRETRPDLWVGRGAYGIGPDSRLFMIWGHAHLLGSGWRGRLRALRVRAQDAALGYHRFSAYDLREAKLQEAAERLLLHRPDYVIGYSVALDRFARANEGRREALRAAGVRVVIGTAESFPAEDSADRLSALFGCPVGMEYGAVETGLLAHTVPEGGYRVFWHSYLLDVEPSGEAHRVFVTSLFPRKTPLVRYEIGDEIEVEPGEPTVGFIRFRRVLGRCNDYVELPGGAIAHSELFTHAVRACERVAGYQVLQQGERVAIRYLASAPLPDSEVQAIRDRLSRIHPALANIPVERVDELERTVAGKTRMIIRR